MTLNVHFDLSRGEKKILQLVNACVSHEMRNPLNSILAQNIKLKDIARQLFGLLQNQIGNVSLQEIYDDFLEATQV